MSPWKYTRDISNLLAYLAYNHSEYSNMNRDEMELVSLFTFGKHKGEMLEDVIEDDPRYIEWMVENDVVPLSIEVEEVLAKRKII